eukprot:SAG11_NODE_1551_length_4697_cov_10.474554_1_plen_99_part_00
MFVGGAHPAAFLGYNLIYLHVHCIVQLNRLMIITVIDTVMMILMIIKFSTTVPSTQLYAYIKFSTTVPSCMHILNLVPPYPAVCILNLVPPYPAVCIY